MASLLRALRREAHAYDFVLTFHGVENAVGPSKRVRVRWKHGSKGGESNDAQTNAATQAALWNHPVSLRCKIYRNAANEWNAKPTTMEIVERAGGSTVVLGSAMLDLASYVYSDGYVCGLFGVGPMKQLRAPVLSSHNEKYQNWTALVRLPMSSTEHPQLCLLLYVQAKWKKSVRLRSKNEPPLPMQAPDSGTEESEDEQDEGHTGAERREPDPSFSQFDSDDAANSAARTLSDTSRITDHREREYSKVEEKQPSYKLMEDLRTSSQPLQVRVHIIEARALRAEDEDSMPNPVCAVSVLGRTQYTKVHKGTSACTFDHPFVREASVDLSAFTQESLDISVYSASAVGRRAIIGSFSMPIRTVYERNGHEVWETWCGLARDGETKVCGYVKISALVLGPGDTAAVHQLDSEHEEVESGASDAAPRPESAVLGSTSPDALSEVLLPSTVHVDKVLLAVSIFAAEELPKMDKIGTCDPFVRVSCAGQVAETSIVRRSQTPQWSERLALPLSFPNSSDSVRAELFDYDMGGKNDLIANLELSLEEIHARPLLPRWYSLYTQPLSLSQRERQTARESQYVGRVLLSAGCSDSVTGAHGRPAPLCERIDPCALPRSEQWAVRVDAFEAVGLGAKDKVCVHVSAGRHERTTSVVQAVKGNARWFEAVEDLYFTGPAETAHLPEIHVGVAIRSGSGWKRLAYATLSARTITAAMSRGETAPTWLELDVDASGGRGDDLVAFLLCRVAVLRRKQAQHWKREPIDEPPRKKFQLRTYLYQCRDLPAADETGLADPYCVVHFGAGRARSTRRNNTLNPLYYEVLSVDVDLPLDLSLAPNIVLLLYDWDKTGGDDVIGSIVVPLRKVSKRWPGRPAWHGVRLRRSARVEGEVLVSFQLIPHEKALSIPKPTLQPRTQQYVLELSVVGLRALQTAELRKPKAVQITFDCGERDSDGQTLSVTTMPTIEPSPENPAHLEVLRLPVSLPIEQHYLPSLTVQVFDLRGGGKKRVPIASGSISLAGVSGLPGTATAQGRGTQGVSSRNDACERGTLVRSPYSESSTADVDSATDIENGGGTDAAPAGDERQPLLASSARSAAGAPGHIDSLASRRAPVRRAVGNAHTKQIPSDLLSSSADIEVGDASMARGTAGGAGAAVGAPTALRGQNALAEYGERTTTSTSLEAALGDLPFAEYPLFRGQVRGTGASGDTLREVGRLKGRIQLLRGGMDEWRSRPPFDLRALFSPRRVVVRLYVVKGHGLIPKDSDGFSDPYLVVSWGPGTHQRIRDRENARRHTLDPLFFRAFEFTVTMPREAQLAIGVWDWDRVGGDDFIGDTTIDLENRWYSERWRRTAEKPVEFRDLWNPAALSAQGQLELWLDMYTEEEASTIPRVPLKIPAPKKHVVRVIVWEARGVAFKDAESSDVFVRGFLEADPARRQSTDVHWRSRDGTASFNWRMQFDIELPTRTPRFVVQLWDKDLASSNDAIGEAHLNLKQLFARSYRLRQTERMDSMWVPCSHPNATGVQGYVRLTVEVMTAREARKRPAGLGRAEPNQHPHLPKPKRARNFNPFRIDRWAKRGVRAGYKFARRRILLYVLTTAGTTLAIFLLNRLFGG